MNTYLCACGYVEKDGTKHYVVIIDRTGRLGTTMSSRNRDL